MSSLRMGQEASIHDHEKLLFLEKLIYSRTQPRQKRNRIID